MDNATQKNGVQSLGPAHWGLIVMGMSRGAFCSFGAGENAMFAILVSIAGFAVLGSTRLEGSPIVEGPNEVLAELVAEMRQSRARIQKARIAWSQLTQVDGFVAGMTASYTRTFELKLDGERMAVLRSGDQLESDGGNGWRVVPAVPLCERWDGELFFTAPGDGNLPTDLALCRTPQFQSGNVLLARVFRGGLGSVDDITVDSFVGPGSEGMVASVSRQMRGGREVILVARRRGNNATFESFDPAKSYHLVYEEWVEDSRVILKRRARVRRMTGVFFPSRIVSRSFDFDGTNVMTNVISVDERHTSFNESIGSIDESEFRISPVVGTEVSDRRGLYPKKYIVGKDVAHEGQVQDLIDTVRKALEDKTP